MASLHFGEAISRKATQLNGLQELYQPGEHIRLPSAMGLAFSAKAHGALASILTMQLFWSSRGHLLLHLQGGPLSSQF